MAKTKAEDAVKTTHETRNLKCKLTKEELEVAADTLARKLDEADAAEDEKKSVAEEYKSRVTALEAEAKVQRHLVRNKYTFRNVDCQLVLNFTTGTAVCNRLDTGETVEARPLNHEEKQMDFKFDGEGAQSEQD